MRTITLTLLLVWATTATFAASSPEFAVGSAATVPAPYGRLYPSVASNGDGFFAVWVDQRGHAFEAIVGARITAEGQILDPHGFVLAAGRVELPQVVWDGSAYQVIWTHRRFTPTAPLPARIMGMRIATDGRVVSPVRVLKDLTLLDTPPLFIGDLPNVSEGAPSVASNGNDWLVVWDGERAGIRARRVLHDGRLDEYDPTILTAGFLPAVACDGVRYALAWQDPWHNSVNYGQRALRIGSIPAEGPLGVSSGTSVAALDSYPSAPSSVTRAGDGRVVVVYTRVSFVPEHGGVERTFLRFIETSGSGPRKRRSAR